MISSKNSDKRLSFYQSLCVPLLILTLLVFSACNPEPESSGYVGSDEGGKNNGQQVETSPEAWLDEKNTTFCNSLPTDLDQAIQKSSLEGIKISFITKGRNHLFDLPYPHDLHRDQDGNLDINEFPNPHNNSIFDKYINLAGELKGFSTNPVIYLRFEAPLDASGIPDDPATFLDFSAPVFLLNVEPDDNERGHFIPIKTLYYLEGNDYLPPNTLAIQPFWGFTLKPATRYALVIKRQLKDPQGNQIGSPGLFQMILKGCRQDLEQLKKLGDIYKPLINLLAEKGQLHMDQIAMATLFTTQQITSQLKSIKNFIDTKYSQPTKVEIESSNTHSNYYLIEGKYQSPNFQKGTPPYSQEGQFQFDQAGVPIVQRQEELRFALAVPKHTMPTNGWPLVIYSHGTGGSYKSFAANYKLSPANMITQRNIAILSIDQPIHGTRAPDGTNQELMTFNFLNPQSSRAIFRQSVVDNFLLLKAIRQGDMVIPANQSPNQQKITINKDKLLFLGHSQGGITGSMLLALEHNFLGSVFSGNGGGLSITLLKRKNPIDMSVALKTVAKIPSNYTLTTFHPVLNLVQTLVDITDPINYAPYYHLRAPGDGCHNLLITQGMKDQQIPVDTNEAFVVAGAIPLVEPIAKQIPGLLLRNIWPQKTPLQHNITADNGTKCTIGLRQYANQDHFAIFNLQEAASTYGNFLQNLANGQAGIIQ